MKSVIPLILLFNTLYPFFPMCVTGKEKGKEKANETKPQTFLKKSCLVLPRS